MTETMAETTIDALTIALIVASVRTQRTADQLLPWVTQRISAEPDTELDVIDLRDTDLASMELQPGEPPHLSPIGSIGLTHS